MRPARWRTWVGVAALLLAAATADNGEEEDMGTGRRLLGEIVDAAVPAEGLAEDNDLWRGLMGDCARSPSFACVGKSVFGYLERSLDAGGDLRLSDGIVFERNEALENKYARSLNEKNSSEHGRSATTTGSLEALTDALYDKGARFAMTHDVRLQLPETMFGGAVLKVSPRALSDDGGALLEVEVSPAPRHDADKDDGEGRIFFKKHKDFKKKLLMSFMALVLVIKMIKVKLIYLLPLLIGVGAAKKLLLKVLLFIFPAFAHLFKFCSTYHAGYSHGYSGKLHHHHHQIAHHHHHVKVPVPVPVPVPAHHTSHTAEEGYPASSYEGGPGGSWDAPSGPGHDYGSRSELASAAMHTEKELASWGLGHSNGNPGDTYAANYGEPSSLAYSAYAPVSASAAGEVRPARNTAPGYATTATPLRKAQHANRQQLQGLELQQHLQRQTQVQQKLQQLRVPQAAALTARPPATTVAVTYDTFYSPILQKMDNVFVQLGFNEEACRERLVCSMYRSPARFSPHSNLISAELSRDPAELQKPNSPNSAVVRFYRYVQAARDGQDQKNCLALYPACTVNTEMWRP